MAHIKLFPIAKKIELENSISTKILKRVPFLKSYDIKIYEKDTLFLQKSAYYDANAVTENTVAYFRIFLYSDFRYSERIINNNKIYNFNLKNTLYIPPVTTDLPELTRHASNIICRHEGKKTSFNKDVIIKKNEIISDSELNEIINMINQKFFELEALAEKHHIDLFN
jgi:hypothetical protein